MNNGEAAPARLFRLSRRQASLVGISTVIAFAGAYYLRYHGIENSQVALACQAGAGTWFCETLRLVTGLFRHSGFGLSALVAASLNLIHPSLVLFTFALVLFPTGRLPSRRWLPVTALATASILLQTVPFAIARA